MRILYVIYFLFLATILFGQNKEMSENKEEKWDLIDNDYDHGMKFTVGATLSSFVNTKTKPEFGYTYGITIRFYRWNSFTISGSVFYTKLNNKAYNIDRKFIDYDGIIYRTIDDLDFSATFLKIPLLIGYNLIKKKPYNLNINIGPGYSRALTDYTKVTKYEITDEIIGKIPEDYRPVDLGISDFTDENSGFDFSVLLNFSVKRFEMGIMYNFQFNKIKNINYLNYLTLTFSLKI